MDKSSYLTELANIIADLRK